MTADNIEYSYDFWKNALEGNLGEIHADHPQPGFYRKRNIDKTGWEQVAIWVLDEDERWARMVATVDGKEVDPNEIWTYCTGSGGQAITKEEYRRVEAGAEWDDEVPGLGHNAPPPQDDYEGLREQIENARDLVKNYDELEDKAQADQAANLRDRLNSLSKQADTLRKEEKRPHDEAAKAIQARWNPLVGAAKEAADWLRDGPITKWMRKADAERKAQEAEAQKEIEEKRKKQEADAERAVASGQPAPIQEEIEDVEEVEPEKLGGVSGRRTGLKSRTSYVVSDYSAALKAVRDQPDVVKAVEKAAIRLAKAGADIPGVVAKVTQVAA